MKTHLQKYWFTYLVTIALIICLFMLFGGNQSIDTHKSEAANLRQENADLKEQLATSQKTQDSLAGNIKRQDSAITVLRAEQKAKDKELTKTKATALSLANDVKVLSRNADGVDCAELARKADSLQETTRWLIELNNAYVELTDSLNASTDRNKADYDMLLAEKDKTISALKAANEKLLAGYESLFADYQKLSKRVKRANLKTKVAAVLAGALAVIAVMK